MSGRVVRWSGGRGTSYRRSSGFTLLELIIALAVFAVVSSMAFAGFWSVQKTQKHVSEKNADLGRLQMAMSILQRDLSQLVARGIRDDFGDSVGPMIGAASGYGQMLEFTHMGLRNPTGLPRSALERVAYGLVDDKLIRLSWPILDRVQGVKPQEMPLLEHIRSMELRFLDLANAWQDNWPPLETGSGPAPTLPKAVEVTIQSESWGKLVRLIRTVDPVVVGGAAGGQSSGGQFVDESPPGENSPSDGR